MNLKIPLGLMDATRLVRGGKLLAATAAIQRALRGDTAEPVRYDREPEADAIEGWCRVVDAERPARVGGQFVTRSYTNSAGTREYKLYLPAVYRGEPMPLIVMLHGCKQGPEDFAAGTRMNALAEEQGFVVAYPGQTAKANGSKCWNWFQPKHQQRERGEPSLIAGIAREVVAAHGLDARRVYVAGLSAGGAMAAVMGTTYPDIFAAIGIHSGLAYASARDVPSAFAAMRGDTVRGTTPKSRVNRPAVGIPTIVFHGDNDTTVHPSNGDNVMSQASPASTSAGGYAAAEHARSVERGEASGRAYTRTTHRNSEGKSVLEQWLIHGAAHAWSGGSVEGSFSDAAGPDASREMLRFFLQHERK